MSGSSRGSKLICSGCDEPMNSWEVVEPLSSIVSERVEYTCPNGHRGYENFGPDGFLSQKAGFYYRDVDTDSDRAGEGDA